ncbi:tetratricopeptide repeat protein [Rapidithrix thailandica]|uniref:Tetratricopeptide repeat protein n=1 Tax=Rapidithrix thailandica TaxID=413964 RepID=A0AAW9S758_9BACT
MHDKKNRFLRAFFPLILLIIALCQLALAQDIEKLQDQLALSKSDTAKATVLARLAEAELQNDRLEEALEHASQGYRLSQKHQFYNGIVGSARVLGKIEMIKRQFPASLDYYLKAMQAVERGGNDPNQKVDLNIDIGNLYQNWDANDKATDHYVKALEIAEEVNDEALQIKILQVIGYARLRVNDYKEAMKYFQEVAEYYQVKNDLHNYALSLKRLSDISLQAKKYEEALDYNVQILGIKRAQNDKEGESHFLNEIGVIYKQLGKDDLALKHFEEALKINRDNNLDKEASISMLINVGVIYQRNREFDRALDSFNEVLDIRKQIGEPVGIANAHIYLASIYQGLGDLPRARNHIQKSIDMAEKGGDRRLMEKGYRKLAEIYEATGSNKKALHAYRRFVELRDEVIEQERKYQEELLQRQLEAEKKEKELKLLLKDQEVSKLSVEKLQVEADRKEQELALLQRDKDLLERDRRLKEATLRAQELQKEQALQALELAKRKLDAEQKDKEITLLNKNKRIQELALKQKELQDKEQAKAIQLLEREKELQDVKLEEEKTMRKFGIGIIVLIVAVLILIIAGYIGKQKANRKLADQNEKIQKQKEQIEASANQLREASIEINQQKEELEEKNASMTASIRYAKRIQNAILPPPEVLNKHFAEHFVIYRPKDMVSGDFYWFTHAKPYSFIAAVDCTGHGVPGAFMSMIGNTLLNQIVKEKKIYQPNKILEELHNGVREALKQRDSTNVDGMDVCLCRIEHGEGDIVNVEYSGAKCPLLFVSDGEVVMLEADRKSIGGWQKEKVHTFSNHKTQLQKGSMVYLTTDGYIDAANGDRRRLGSKKLREIVRNEAYHDIQTQLQRLEETLDTHQKDADQRDDITLIGVRL